MALQTQRKEQQRKNRRRPRAGKTDTPDKILTIDIGGSKIKILVSGEHGPRKAPSGAKLTPAKLVEKVKELAGGWAYEAISIGYPGLVGPNGPRSEPGNLGPGWVGFNFAAAFDRPVRIINDAAMQALGSYQGGRMLFLGLGTGLGSALIFENVIVPLELGQLPHRKHGTFGKALSREGLKRLGKKAWRKVIDEAVASFTSTFGVDYIVLGGGNARHLQEAPPGSRVGHNLTAFRGGFKLWHLADIETLSDEQEHQPTASRNSPRWRVL